MSQGIQSFASRAAAAGTPARPKTGAGSGTGRGTGRGIGRGIGGALTALFDTLALWAERRRQRRDLEALPDHLLSDIGVSRSDAANEADKPFWRG
ncbi:DUF1127 domain-containing protein [Azospirillum sp. SYSU D00513]|uniref:DUF1127 domain-containing protein n=1 Tax=Azospirillum sp. SYSU D00513 TaxID=2812561 RepID=UPI001A96CEC8|nr:DUF1127 domain-containing protein [Azospirillum sp. SYSU D00513]